MTRDSFMFYRSFYEAIKELPRDIQGEVYTAIMEYGLNGITTEKKNPIVDAVLILTKPAIDRGVRILETDYARTCPEYRNWRFGVFERDNFTCQMCGKTGVELNAHHIKPFATYKELRYDLSNGVTLCKNCHIKVHKKKQK